MSHQLELLSPKRQKSLMLEWNVDKIEPECIGELNKTFAIAIMENCMKILENPKT